ncbi:MAG: glycerol-3-phosphate dehydrogenase [Aestuariivita sp.]|nr:glycerol-3-phosphate dehydrogenase [Aestuariivita sp.]
MKATSNNDVLDLFIVGGGINGCGIARDAAGRGLNVALAEMNDLGSGTSSASTKLIHGGLRYLEYFEFRLVRESLEEREVLLRTMPHIIWPLRFVLPYHHKMRFESDTPASRLLNSIMPWQRGRRPAWLIRLALLMYDSFGKRSILPSTSAVQLSHSPEGQPLRDEFHRAFEYSDCWVQDSRLVILNARDAAEKGALIMPRTRVINAKRKATYWTIITKDVNGNHHSFKSRTLINATGPWASNFLENVIGIPKNDKLRLVRGSHIVTKRLFAHEKCYLFQGTDGRIVFVIPYEQDFTLIGTTDYDQDSVVDRPECTQQEIAYLLEFVSKYFKKPITRSDVVWTYSGVRPLYNASKSSASAASRDYVICFEEFEPPLLNIFGGKLTTYRKLAETVLQKLIKYFPHCGPSWTADRALPGGDFSVNGVPVLAKLLCESYPYLNNEWAYRLIRHYGTDAHKILEGTSKVSDLGENFTTTVTEREIEWVVKKEWVYTAEDFLWRRTRLGLRFQEEATKRLDNCIQKLRASNFGDKHISWSKKIPNNKHKHQLTCVYNNEDYIL